MGKILHALLALGASAVISSAWDYEGHRIVNQLALASLPTNFPAFVRQAETAERIAFLAGEPDRWRNSISPTFKHAHAPDHFLDIDDLPLHGITTKTASPFRYDFTAQLKLERDKHPERFPPIDPTKNTDHSRDLVGFLPWTINEYYGKLESAFSYLKTFEQHGGTPVEIGNAQQNISYIMGVMGHYAGDASQPLHTTKHFNGWVGANPNRYSTNRTIHSWIDGGFIRKAEIRVDELRPKVRGARALAVNETRGGDIFDESMSFVEAQFKLVERTYQLDRDGKLSPGKGDVTEGREFIGGQLLQGGQFLGDLWFTAWQKARFDTYLRGELTRRSKP